jgi:phage recombination protein Bet
MDNAIVKYMTDGGGQVELSPDIIRNYLVSGNGEISDQEVMMFLKLCQYQKLNPFLREVYIIKFGDFPATTVTGKETFLKRAMRNPKYEGHTTGISEDGKEAWAEVYLDGYQVPIKCEVDYDEYVGLKNGKPNKMWESKPKTMLKKVALVQALREAFPEDLGGLYSQEEINSVSVELPTTPVKPAVQKTQSKSSQKQTTSKKKEPEGEEQEHLIKVVRIGKKDTKKNPKYTLYSAEDAAYNTFDQAIADDAKEIEGTDIQALVIFTTDKWGNTIKSFTVTGAEEFPENFENPAE